MEGRNYECVTGGEKWRGKERGTNSNNKMGNFTHDSLNYLTFSISAILTWNFLSKRLFNFIVKKSNFILGAVR